MKLYQASSLLSTLCFVFKYPCAKATTKAPRWRQSSSVGDIPQIEIFPACRKKNRTCSKKRVCCEGLKCTKQDDAKKCLITKKKKKYQLQKTFAIDDSVFTGNNYEPMSMSDDGNVVLFDTGYLTFLRNNIFEKDIVTLPSHDAIFRYIENEFDPRWVNAVSGNGQVIALANYDNDVVVTYRRIPLEQGPGWEQFGGPLRKLDVSLGTSVALSEDGSILIVGADEYLKEDGLGFAQRYELSQKDVWFKKGSRIVGDFPGDELGRRALQISSDGNRVAVGGGTNGFASVYDWQKKDKTWKKIERLSFDCKGWSECTCDLTCIQKEDTLDTVYNDPRFGEEEIRMSSDGNILAVSDWNFDANRNEMTGDDGVDNGAIYFYQYVDGKFIEFAETLVGPAGSEYGWRFAMSDDGNTVVVGEYENDDGAVNLVRILKRNQATKKFISVQTIPNIDLSGVEISRDGKKLAIYGWNPTAVYLFTLV